MKEDTEANLRVLARRVERARRVEARAWSRLKVLMKEAYDDEEDPTTLEEIGKIIGVTKARVYQLITGRRSTRSPSPGPSPKRKPRVRKAAKSTSES